MSKSIHLQLTLHASPSDVFHALTDEKALTTWFAEHAAVIWTHQTELLGVGEWGVGSGESRDGLSIADFRLQAEFPPDR